MSSLTGPKMDLVNSSKAVPGLGSDIDLDWKPCTTCNAPSMTSCPECGGVEYCSRECKDDDYKTHKYLCRRASRMEKRPSPNFKRGLLLTASEHHPKWIWICMDQETTPEGTSECIAIDQSRLEKNGEWKDMKIGRLVRRNDMRARDLDNALEFHFDNPFNVEENGSVVPVTRGRARFRRTGSILVLKTEGLAEEPARYLDIEIEDYRDAADYLAAWPEMNCNNEQWAAHWVIKRAVSGTKAVLIECKGLQERTKCKP